MFGPTTDICCTTIDSWVFDSRSLFNRLAQVTDALEKKFPKNGATNVDGLWFDWLDREVSLGPDSLGRYCIYISPRAGEPSVKTGFTKSMMRKWKKEILNAMPFNDTEVAEESGFWEGSKGYRLVLKHSCPKSLIRARSNANKLKKKFGGGFTKEEMTQIVVWYMALYKNMGIVLEGNPFVDE